MNKPFVLILMVFFAFAKAYSQQQPIIQDSTTASIKNDTILENQQKPLPEDAVKEFFKNFHQKDTVSLRNMMLPNTSLNSLLISESKGRRAVSKTMGDFFKGLVKIPDSIAIEERLIEVKSINSVDIATVSTSYEFYVNNQFSHNGTNVFTLVYIDDKWKITALADTRYYP